MDQTTLALSWKIATQPLLYKELAANPYSQKALQIGQENFPGINPVDIIWAVVLAEPEGKYDRSFNFYPPEVQEGELFRQTIKNSEITGRLNDYYSQNSVEFKKLPADLKYEILFKVAFETTDLEEIDQKFSQGQRKSIKLLIMNYIGQVDYQPQIQNLPPKHRLALRPIKLPKPGKKFSRSVIVILSSISLFFFTAAFLDYQNFQARTNQISFPQLGQVSSNKSTDSFPARLKIPSINVDAPVEYIGMTPGGAMDVPKNITDVGWYQLGPTPGQRGSAVISGHFDGNKGESGVFNNLDKLKKGDQLSVINNLGVITNFIVRESRIYKPGSADDVFYALDNGAHLNLVTCDGIWDLAKKSYTKRLVVFTDMF